VYPLLSCATKFLPPFFTLVTVPVWLSRMVARKNTSIYRRNRRDGIERSQFVLRSLFGRLCKLTRKLTPVQAESVWSSYTGSNSYSPEDFSAKTSFVERALVEARPKRVLDIGCNTGYFSAIAARQGARVVGIDSDPVVVGQTWHHARKEDLDILPLVVNIANPTPPLGWCNRESASFLDRSLGVFDVVMMLAVVHHVMVTGQIPLREIAALAAELTKDLLLIEYVGPEDRLFRSLTLGRDHLYAGLTREAFESFFLARFDIMHNLRLGSSTRSLYVMKKKR